MLFSGPENPRIAPSRGRISTHLIYRLGYDSLGTRDSAAETAFQ